MTKKKVPKVGAKKTTADQVKALRVLAPNKQEVEPEILENPDKKDRFGRPSVMTQAVLFLLNEAFGWGCSNPEAALHAGISLSTLEKYLAKNLDFKEHADQLKESPTLLARGTLVKSLKKSPYYAFKYLERKKSDEFSLKIKQTFEEPEPLSPEEEALIDEVIDENF